MLKTFPHIDFHGLSSAGVTATFKAEIDGSTISKTFNAKNYISTPSGAKALGKYKLGTYPVGAGPTKDEMPTEDFDIRINLGYTSGRRIQPKVELSISKAKSKIKKMEHPVTVNPINVFPPDHII